MTPPIPQPPMGPGPHAGDAPRPAPPGGVLPSAPPPPPPKPVGWPVDEPEPAEPEAVAAPEPEPIVEPAPEPVAAPLRHAPTAARLTPVAAAPRARQADEPEPVDEVAPAGAEAVDTPAPAQPANPAPAPHTAPPFVPGKVPSSAQLGLPSSREEVRDYVRHAAAVRGIDPDVALRVVLSEGGLTPATWVGDGGSSFGPLQLHYGGIAPGGNSVAGLGDTFTRQTGYDARDPSTWRLQVDHAFSHAKVFGWGDWRGAKLVGIGPRQGILNVASASGGAMYAAAYQLGPRRHLTVPNQFDSALSSQDAYAACGPVAAVAVARWLGRNPSVPEVLEVAKRVGWTRDGGMNGIANEKRLLDAMGIAAHVETPINWRHVRADALSGNPVILSSPGHYWVINNYNVGNGTYQVGQSGLAYKGGAEWMTGAQIQELGGHATGALYVDHPLSPKQSVAVTHAKPAPASPAGQELVSDRWWKDLPAAPSNPPPADPVPRVGDDRDPRSEVV